MKTERWDRYKSMQKMTFAEFIDRLRRMERLSGADIRRMMRRHGATIRSVAAALQVTQKRVREVREKGIMGQGWIRDWVEAIERAGRK